MNQELPLPLWNSSLNVLFHSSLNKVTTILCTVFLTSGSSSKGLNQLLPWSILSVPFGHQRCSYFKKKEFSSILSLVDTYSSGFLLFFPVYSAPTEPLLCKFADGGQKKRQNPNKYIPNGRPWHREGEVRLVSPFLELLWGCVITKNTRVVTRAASWRGYHIPKIGARVKTSLSR